MGVFHQTMVEALCRHGLDVTVMVPTPIISRQGRSLVYRRAGLGVKEQGDRILRPRYLPLPGQITLGIIHWLMRVAFWGVNLRKYDVIHAHFGYPMGLLAATIRMRTNVPCVLTLHGSDVNVYPQLSSRHLRQFQDAISKMDRVLAVSQALAQRTRELTGSEPEVLRTGIDMSGFQQTLTKREARRRLGLPEDSYLILYVGNFIKAKGISELLSALSRYKGKNVYGIFVGAGPLESEIRTADNTILLGAVPNSQVPTIMSAADVLALPSYQEGLGTVLVEAGVIQLPVVATRVGGIPEVISNDTGILIEPRSDNELYEALENVRLNYDDALERAAKLKAHVAQEYNVDMNAKKLLNVYQSVM